MTPRLMVYWTKVSDEKSPALPDSFVSEVSQLASPSRTRGVGNLVSSISERLIYGFLRSIAKVLLLLAMESWLMQSEKILASWKSSYL